MSRGVIPVSKLVGGCALSLVGTAMKRLNVSQGHLETPGTVIQIGLPLPRIDILTSLTGPAYEASWAHRATHRVEQMDLPCLGREHLIRNKRATGRSRHLTDVEILEAGPGKWSASTPGTGRSPGRSAATHRATTATTSSMSEISPRG